MALLASLHLDDRVSTVTQMNVTHVSSTREDIPPGVRETISLRHLDNDAFGACSYLLSSAHANTSQLILISWEYYSIHL